MPSISVCLSPLLFKEENLAEKNVVVIDVLRATSTICTALHHGVGKVIPVSKLETCRSFSGPEYLLAAERNGLKPEGFQYGNSPFDYMSSNVKGKTLVLTTSNGTRAIGMAKTAKNVLIGSFLNLDKLVAHLAQKEEDCLLFCAGWKGGFSMEDTLFAGAVAYHLQNQYSMADDAALAARQLYASAKNDISGLMKNSSHYKRLAGHGIEKDITYCLSNEQIDVLPFLDGDAVVI